MPLINKRPLIPSLSRRRALESLLRRPGRHSSQFTVSQAELQRCYLFRGAKKKPPKEENADRKSGLFLFGASLSRVAN